MKAYVMVYDSLLDRWRILTNFGTNFAAGKDSRNYFIGSDNYGAFVFRANEILDEANTAKELLENHFERFL